MLAAGVAVVVAVLAAAPPALADNTRDAQWHLDFLRIDEAHRITKGAGVTVAVVDSGVDPRHPDLDGAVLPGADFSPKADGKGDGRVDSDGHGTAMAGVIGARGHGTGDGALGIAPEAHILPVRDTSDLGTGRGTADAIKWATAHGADVINMSLGGPGDSPMKDAVADALRADVVLVAAAGNRPSKVVDYPAAYPGVIAVAGVGRDGTHAKISVTGPEVVLAAPSDDIRSTDKGGKGYHTGTGTSDATAIVAGVAALVRAKFPDLSAAEVTHRLVSTAKDAGAPGRDEVYGYGIVDPVAALTAEVPPMPKPTGAAEPTEAPLPGAGAPSIEHDKGSQVLRAALIGGVCLLLTVFAVLAVVLLIRRRKSPVY